MHELGRTEIFVSIEKLFSCKFALAIFVISVFIPRWIACVSINTEIIGGGQPKLVELSVCYNDRNSENVY